MSKHNPTERSALGGIFDVLSWPLVAVTYVVTLLRELLRTINGLGLRGSVKGAVETAQEHYDVVEALASLAIDETVEFTGEVIEDLSSSKKRKRKGR